ncbi:MAG: hypothetical protein KKB21_04765, partial [Nanoarchaeota archaeon]|nr:hypothetical protein [Nanoarchaeota archaeon]
HPGGSTVVYQGHWIDLQDNGKQIIFLIERGPKFQYLYDGLEKYLQNAHIDSKDSLIVSSRSMSRQGGEVAITLNLSKINDQEKIYHAVYRVGMKPIMAALLRIS